MKKLRFIPALAFVLGLSIPVFAGTPENAKKDNATETETEAKTGTGFTYYVSALAGSGSQYVLTTTPQPGCDNITNYVCKFTSPDELPQTVDRTTVENEEDGIEVESWRSSL